MSVIDVTSWKLMGIKVAGIRFYLEDVKKNGFVEAKRLSLEFAIRIFPRMTMDLNEYSKRYVRNHNLKFNEFESSPEKKIYESLIFQLLK